MFRLLFYSPRIPPNTGNAIRTAAATGAELHLVEPLGFDLSEPNLRRAGLDYHDLASVTVHPSLEDAWSAIAPQRVFAFTAHATHLFTDVSYQAGDVLMFGPEPTGLDAETLADPHITERVRIPMLDGRRSLNLANAAAVAVYEAWRQLSFAGATTMQNAKRCEEEKRNQTGATTMQNAKRCEEEKRDQTGAKRNQTGAV